MSPYERQIEESESVAVDTDLAGVDITYVLGVPGQARSVDETMEPLLSMPLSAQRLNGTTSTAGSSLVGSSYGPTASELLAAAGIEVGPGIAPGTRASLGYDPALGYDDTGSLYRVMDRDTEVNPVVSAQSLLSTSTWLTSKVRIGLAVAAVVVLGTVAAVVASDADGPSTGQLERANGAATQQVLARDLGASLGTYAAGGLPVTLANTAHSPLAYNVTVEALDAAGRRIAADVAFVGTLAPGQSTVATLFANVDAATATELAGAQFHVVEASAY